MSREKCVCGERGENSINCKMFGHGQIYNGTEWLSNEETAELEHSDFKGFSKNCQGFWFWDETEASAHGPYGTIEDARTAVAAYCRDELLG